MRRFATICAVTAITLVVLAAPAGAHVTISPQSAPKGSDAVLSFISPNESTKNAKVVKVVVHFRADHPIADALTEPMAGWTAAVATVHSATPIQTDSGQVSDRVDTVTWTAAAGGGTPPDNFQEFSVSIGLPDDADTLDFPTDQYYSDGSVVSWNEATPAGGPEPEHPRPELTLTAGGATTPTTTPATTSSNVSKSDVDNAKTLGTIGLIVGAVGLVVAIVAIVLSRKKKATT